MSVTSRVELSSTAVVFKHATCIDLFVVETGTICLTLSIMLMDFTFQT